MNRVYFKNSHLNIQKEKNNYQNRQTKISLNSKITKNKFSTIERSMNRYLVFLIIILLTEMISATILTFSFDYEFLKVSNHYQCHHFSLSFCSQKWFQRLYSQFSSTMSSWRWEIVRIAIIIILLIIERSLNRYLVFIIIILITDNTHIFIQLWFLKVKQSLL